MWEARKVAMGLVFALSLVGLSACGDEAGAGTPDEGSEDRLDEGPGMTGKPVADTSGELFCQVRDVMTRDCGGCHGAELKFGAPMPLVEYDDFLAPAVSDGSRKVFELVQDRIRDAQRPMPPASVGDPMEDADADLFDHWIASGMPQASDCAAASAPPVSVDPAELEPYEGVPDDCEDMFEIRAHGQPGKDDTTGYDVSAVTQGDYYECFNYKVPWGEQAEVQGLWFAPIIDDSRVVHHWILYGNDEGGEKVDGGIGACAGKGSFIAGWAPGGKATRLPRQVGFEMPSGPNAFLTLELHYNNAAGHTDAVDRSGVRFCTSSTFREHTAAVHWLGDLRQLLQGIEPGSEKTITNRCTPALGEPVHILSMNMHMHRLGVRSKVVINRAGGGKDVIIDGPFDFNDQGVTPNTDAVLMPGDTIDTSCIFNNTTNKMVGFGEGTDDEMCFNFVTAYPAGALSMDGPYKALGGGSRTCID